MMKRLTVILTFVFCFSFGFLSAARSADEVKIGFVNPQRIIEESKAGKDAYQKLKDLQEQHRRKVEARKAEIDKQEEEYKKQYLTLSESARAEKEEAFRKAKKEFKRMLEDADSEISAKEKAFLDKIDKEVMAIIEKIGKEEGYSIIFGQMGSAVLYVSPVVDITDKVIQEYDKTYQN